MSENCDNCDKLKDAYANILQDNVYMCQESIKKSDILLNRIANIDADTVDYVKTELKKLLERMTENLTNFMDRYNISTHEYKGSCESSKPKSPNTPKNRSRLSLRKNGETQETDVDLTNSETEDLCSSTAKIKTKEKARLNESLKDLSSKLDKHAGDEEALSATRLITVDTPLDARKRAQKNNHELLELLNKATDNERYPKYVTTEQEGDEALRELEDDISWSTRIDSDDSYSVFSANEDSDLELNSPHQSDESDVESIVDEQPDVNLEECKNFTFKMTRIDDLSDEAIDRLCNLHNLNKRKCVSMLRPQRRRVKRPRLLSTSSSSLSSLSSGSTTPDLNLDQAEEQRLLSPVNNGNMSDLADEFCNKLTDSEDESETSSGSETDIEEKPVAEQKEKKEKEEIKENKPKEPKEKRRKASWEDNPLLKGLSLWSESDNDFESDSEKPKPVMTNMRKIENGTTIIFDSSDSDSDVTLIITFLGSIPEGGDDESSGKGRRNIRAIIDDDNLDEMTQRAKSEEDRRIQRLEDHSKTVRSHLWRFRTFNTSLSQIESIQSQHEDFVLDVDVKTGKPVIVVDQNLVRKLKPHQKDGVKFMWDACYESVDILKTNSGTGKHDLEEKSRIVRNWRAEGGVLVMGYEAFQMLSMDKDNKKKRKKEAKELPPEAKKKVLEALVDPGPDLVICDEGHLLKNGETLRTQALMKLATKRRVVLTGTPLQNNLVEYYCMVHFVKPHLLGTFPEYRNRFVNPIMNGQFDNSTPEDIKLMKKRTHVLAKLLKNTVNRVESKVLEGYLPEIEDYTIFTKLEPIQIELYRRYIDLVKSHTTKTAGFFQDFRITKFMCLHPYTVHLYYTDLKNRKKKKENEVIRLDEDVDDNANITNLRVKEGWYEDLYPGDMSTNINYSAKLKVLLAIINETVRNGEKALIFAHQLPELDCIEHFLKTYGTSDCPVWTSNVNYCRMDGHTVSPENRNQLCEEFNRNPNIKVFLISHGVGGLGLNLTAASRVILIASNHNPSHDTQSIYRAYRFGQTKKCYVYRLLSLVNISQKSVFALNNEGFQGSMEEKIYRRCVVKLAVAGTVVDKFHFDRHFKATDLQQMYEYDFESHKERPIPLVPNDKLLATLLQNNEDIFSYHEHRALLENRPEEELNDEEKKLAWDEFKKEEEREEAASIKCTSLTYTTTTTTSSTTNGTPTEQGNNASNMVINPMSYSARGPNPRGFPPQVRSDLLEGVRNIRPNILRASTSNMYKPQFNGYNRNVPRAPFNQNNLPKPSEGSGANNQQSNRPPAPFFPRDLVEKLLRTNPAAQKLQRLAQKEQPQNVVNLADEAPTSGEFNYALNKM
ncbi:transcriptional regulator ATRX -like, partial [Asbolus verrucosus]